MKFKYPNTNTWVDETSRYRDKMQAKFLVPRQLGCCCYNRRHLVGSMYLEWKKHELETKLMTQTAGMETVAI